MGSWLVVAGTAVALFASACIGGGAQEATSPSPERTSSTPSASPTTLPLGIPGCPHTQSPSHPWREHLEEVRGTAEGGDLWALIFQEPGTPIRAGKQVKIVWRMTGTGDLGLEAVNAKGTQRSHHDVRRHEGSNWDRPGDEWGSLFTFPEPGCWDIHAERASVTGDVWLSAE